MSRTERTGSAVASLGVGGRDAGCRCGVSVDDDSWVAVVATGGAFVDQDATSVADRVVVVSAVLTLVLGFWRIGLARL